ncbi:hypothetical protein D0439_13165 [Lysinibacillus fusiformis]|uniref:hypothetical protein n=1 Tax=Lysinibacillus TaxID=400634 RepID=UPI0004D67474|nr:MULTISPECIES: hypothetical protein [Lysinibacillus]AJK88144.1 hypothetical protein HR49_13880 [Lysinibacillus fusiformis]KHK51063.1 hypothetical protein PI85_15640 [Lysinibacillus sp. A1]MCE4042823.1 hypothetical protein [Lysinibacillus fusiformis]MCT6927701.1 hypothetical protein [Lysinibacillus fusiformis]MCT6932335.1 hypothetical protein [Lysinibacillus fusiformis]
MKRLLQGFFLLMFAIVVISWLIVEKQPSPIPVSTSNSPTYAEEFSEKLQVTNFTQKIIQAVRKAGYSPDSTVGYLVDSPNHQIITIQLHGGSEIEKSTESEIQSIIHELAKEDNMGAFIVNVELLEIK